MQRLAGLEIVFDHALDGGEPHIPVFIFAGIVHGIVPLGIQLVVRQIHPRVAGVVEVITPVEHAEPYLPRTVFVQAVHGKWRELGSVDKTVVEIVVTENAVFRTDKYFPFTQYLDTTYCTVLDRMAVLQQVVMLDHLPGLYVHQVDTVYHMADPQVVARSGQSADIGVGETFHARYRLVVGECLRFLFHAVHTRVFRTDPSVSIGIATDIAYYFTFQ